MNKVRYIALTDIVIPDGKAYTEVDDVESVIRLILYSDVIDIEGIIPCTSVFKKKTSAAEKEYIHSLINAYSAVKPHLDIHSDSYPSAEYLHSVVKQGIPVYGKHPGKGFADSRYSDNEGVQKIIESADSNDPRPLWIGLWGGANTLAQAVWFVRQTRSEKRFNLFLSKLRIYGISDQDAASRWLRENFGDRLFYIVSPSKGTTIRSNVRYFADAAWTGISCDHQIKSNEYDYYNHHFKGARDDLVTEEWLKENICKGELGKLYPLPSYSMEGDTPAFLGLIPNGLNFPERPDFGGWGGRYEKDIPNKKYGLKKERYPIWTDTSDTVIGCDKEAHTGTQATVWRWREAFQNDFAARIEWTVTDSFKDACHPPIITAEKTDICVQSGESVTLSVNIDDPDANGFDLKWFCYPEAGTASTKIQLPDAVDSTDLCFNAPDITGDKATFHIIAEVTARGKYRLTRYCRFILTVKSEWCYNGVEI